MSTGQATIAGDDALRGSKVNNQRSQQLRKGPVTYTSQLLDRRTGEVMTISLGDFVTVTELGELYGVGHRKVRSILRHMNFLGVEGGRSHNRHRILPWAVKQGLGKRIEKGGHIKNPFDVISPEGRAWIEERWSAAVKALERETTGGAVSEAQEALAQFQQYLGRSMDVQAAVCWLRHCFPDLTHQQIGNILDVSQQLVSRYANLWRRQLAARRKAITEPLAEPSGGPRPVSCYPPGEQG